MWRVFFLVGFVYIVLTQWVSAASLYLDPARTELFRGDAITVSVRLDTDESTGECVNAVDAVLTYSEQIIPVDTSIGSSIISLWVEQPTIDTENRRITFAGGIPNGYCGRVQGDPRLTNVLAQIIFRSPGLMIGGGTAGDEAVVSFLPETSLYLNDGRGTRAALTTYDSIISLSRSPGNALVDPWTDTVRNDVTSPEAFGIEVVRIPPEYGRYFAIFDTTDKQTGIDSYQIIEEPIEQLGNFAWGRADAPWVTARSPYELRDQSLNSTIRVRAVDKAGNETFAVFVPEQHLRQTPYETYVVFGFGMIVVMSMILIGVLIWRKRRSSMRNASESEPNDNSGI